MLYQFNQYELDEQRYELRHAKQTVKIEPKVFDVLAYLIRYRNRVVSKEELRTALWGGEFVTNDALVRCIVEARKAVQDDGDRQDIIKTFRCRGYQFVAAVQERQGTDITRDAFQGLPHSEVELLTPRSHMQNDVFVGRQPERQALQACLRDAGQGHGQLVLLSGEAGIGKTRLATEIANGTRQQDVHVLRGRCHDSDNTPDFWLWRQIVQTYVQDCQPSTLREVMGAGIGDLAVLAPMLHQRIPSIPLPLGSKPQEARFRCFDSFTTFIKNAAAKQPLLIILDDLQWADTPSLQLLQFLAYELREARVLILCTCRDNGLARHHPLKQTLGELSRSEIYQRLTLQGFSIREIIAYIEHVASHPKLQSLAVLLRQKTEGNPFFVKEIVRALMQHNRFTETSDPTAWPLPVPYTVNETISYHLAALSSTCVRVLTIAAVIGRTFTPTILAQLIELSDADLMTVMEEALDARIIEEVPANVCQYRFRNALVHDNLYQSLITLRRVDLHRQIGLCLETQNGSDLESRLPALAHHFCKAAAGGDARMMQKAIDYAFQVDQQAIQAKGAGDRAYVLPAEGG
jgi:predicted ATPase/DNA-binding winged helix-turn-helix (wHTH) protein